jgi:hypothetical protein
VCAQVLLDDVSEYLRDSAAAGAPPPLAPAAAQQQQQAQHLPLFDAAGRQLITFAPPVPAGCRDALKAFLDHITARDAAQHTRVHARMCTHMWC